MATIDKNLKCFVRLDGNLRVVSGSAIYRRKMPKVGKWVEINSNICCTTTTSTTQNPD